VYSPLAPRKVISDFLGFAWKGPSGVSNGQVILIFVDRREPRTSSVATGYLYVRPRSIEAAGCIPRVSARFVSDGRGGWIKMDDWMRVAFPSAQTLRRIAAESAMSRTRALEAAESVLSRRQRDAAAIRARELAVIKTFPLDSFPSIPDRVRAELNAADCVVPQTYVSHKPHNVIRGRFAAKDQVDWAALCSRSDTSMIVVVWGGPVTCPSPVGQGTGWVQGIGGGKLGFSRAIDVANIAAIDELAKAYNGPPAPARDHDGINDAFIEKASTILFCHGGKWVRLQGAD
jgi:hypothetical protein